MSRNPLYDYAKQLEEKASKIEVASKGLVKGIKKIIPQKAAMEYRNIANTVIKEFYDSYTPDYYNNRTYSLYNAFKIKSGYGWVDWKLTSGGLDGHRASQELIFDYMIEGGWHGGAMADDGIMRYRKPVDKYYYWGRPAVNAGFSPMEEIEKRILQRSKKGWEKEQEQLAIQAFKGVI